MKRKGNLPLFILPPDFFEYVFMPRFRSRINTSAFLSATRLPTPPPLFVSITPGAVTFPFVRKCSFYRRLPHYTVSSYPGKIAPTAALTNKKKRKKELTFSVFFQLKSLIYSRCTLRQKVRLQDSALCRILCRMMHLVSLSVH